MMKLLLSEYAGFCFGVKRAVDLLEKQIQKGDKRIFMLGHLIHNDDFLRDMEKRGVKCIEESELEQLNPETDLVILRTHGVKAEMEQHVKDLGLPYLDTACPYVKKIHNIVKTEQETDDPQFIIIGDKNHPEVEGIVSRIEKRDNDLVLVCKDAEELEKKTAILAKTSKRRWIILAQTTQNIAEWKKCLKKLKKLYTNLTIFDTICYVTEKRQCEAASIARMSDMMVVIGGKASSNTNKLAEITSEYCPTLLIENESELKTHSLKPNMTVGITAGASTPDRIIEEVLKTMSEMKNVEEGMSFQEMLDHSFRTLVTGERVTGVITSILPNEIHVDLGIKHTGILPADEVADDSNIDLHELFKVGDDVTVMVQKFNDAEGTVQVSKKKVDNYQNWDKVVEASESSTVLKAKVQETNKSGVVVSWKGVRIFIPASQSGLPKEASLNELMGKEISFIIISLDPSRRRVVGSIRAVIRAERKAKQEKFWNEIEVAKQYTGVVKSITAYGAFVDLGGVDGMVHITELSWKRIKHPTDVLNVGDEVTVFVKEFNPETHRISLGYKTEDENPWVILPGKYNVGDTAEVKIVGLTSFGAFAELIPGVDGLIHISQLSDRNVNNVAEVVRVGDVVNVKITDINYETKKVSLSIRALLHSEDTAVEDTAVEDTAVEDTAVDNTAVDDTAVDDTAVDDTAVEDTAVEDTAVEDTAVDDTSMDDTAMDDTEATTVE